MRFLLTKLSHFFIFFLGLSVTAPFYLGYSYYGFCSLTIHDIKHVIDDIIYSNNVKKITPFVTEKK